MAGWKESMSRFAQSAVSKSKEMAEVTRLNMEISNLEQRIRERQQTLGAYLLEHPEMLPHDDATVDNILRDVSLARENIARDQELVLEVRNINICPQCGAEVSRTSKFCNACGAPIDRSMLETPAAANLCPQCGTPLENGAAFCGNCGAKL